MRPRWRWRAASIAACAVALVGTAAARADNAVLPADAPLPWSSPAHSSPLEQLLDPVVAQTIGRPGLVRCEGDYDWGLLSAQGGLASTVWGYVEFYGNSPLGFAELSPQACTYLQRFAEANPKPTKCSPPQTVYVERRVSERQAVRVRVKSRGRWTWRTGHKTVHTTETDAEQVQGQPVPCFATDGSPAMPMPDSYWRDYSNYAMALLTVAHEPFHIAGDTNEATVNCHGLQRIALFAQALGDTPDDAEQIARYAQQYVIPAQSPEYQLPADCHDGGSLDLDPSSSVWP